MIFARLKSFYNRPAKLVAAGLPGDIFTRKLLALLPGAMADRVGYISVSNCCNNCGFSKEAAYLSDFEKICCAAKTEYIVEKTGACRRHTKMPINSQHQDNQNAN